MDPKAAKAQQLRIGNVQRGSAGVRVGAGRFHFLYTRTQQRAPRATTQNLTKKEFSSSLLGLNVTSSEGVGSPPGSGLGGPPPTGPRADLTRAAWFRATRFARAPRPPAPPRWRPPAARVRDHGRAAGRGAASRMLVDRAEGPFPRKLMGTSFSTARISWTARFLAASVRFRPVFPKTWLPQF